MDVTNIIPYVAEIMMNATKPVQDVAEVMMNALLVILDEADVMMYSTKVILRVLKVMMDVTYVTLNVSRLGWMLHRKYWMSGGYHGCYIGNAGCCWGYHKKNRMRIYSGC